MKSGLDAEFVAVPGTDDVAFGFVVLLRPRGLVARDRLEHAFHDAALADRAGAMRTSVMPGVEFAADLEDADFRISAHDHLAIAVGVVVDLASHILGHPRPPHSRCRRARKRRSPPSLREGFATGRSASVSECDPRRRLIGPPILYLDGAIRVAYREGLCPRSRGRHVICHRLIKACRSITQCSANGTIERWLIRDAR